EALAMEVPVVTTPAVAAGLRVEGMEPQLVIGRNAEEIAACILRLLANSEERARLSTEGRRFVEAHCSWSRSAEKLEKLCLAAAGHISESSAPAGVSAGSDLVCPK